MGAAYRSRVVEKEGIVGAGLPDIASQRKHRNEVRKVKDKKDELVYTRDYSGIRIISVRTRVGALCSGEVGWYSR